jgi:hypothetical protein
MKMGRRTNPIKYSHRQPFGDLRASSPTTSIAPAIALWGSGVVFGSTRVKRTSGKYGKRFFDQYKEKMQIGDYAWIRMIRNESAMSHP